MISSSVIKHWIVGGPSLLFDIALRSPLYFFCTFVVALALSVLLFSFIRASNWKKSLFVAIVTYIILLLEWFTAAQLYKFL